jgi:hypothetical protein
VALPPLLANLSETGARAVLARRPAPVISHFPGRAARIPGPRMSQRGAGNVLT